MFGEMEPIIGALHSFFRFLIRKKVELPKEDFNEILGEKGCKLVTDGYPWFYELFEYKI